MHSNKSVTHGHTRGGKRSATYQSWASMLQRCLNKNSPAYDRYGAVGRTVCERWKHFKNFLKDMGECPAGLTLERKNNSKGYSKQNCRWASYREQRLNSAQHVRWFTHAGETKSLTDWCRNFGISYGTARWRMDCAGLSFIDAMTRQVNHTFNSSRQRRI